MELKYSFPKLTESQIEKLEVILSKEFDYPSLPKDYKVFLMKNNGGYVTPGYIDDEKDEHTQEVVFDTPLKWVRDSNKPVSPCIVFFFGVFLEDEMDIDQVEKDDMYELVLSNRDSKEEFEILPDRMMSIAKCSSPNAADMLCISLHEEDFGAVYFYYDMWHYPAKFHGSYYDDREKDIFVKYGIDSEDDIDSETSIGKAIEFELSKVPFVKVADSFSEFLNLCRIADVEA